MKANALHRAPLPEPAIDLLRKMEKFGKATTCSRGMPLESPF